MILSISWRNVWRNKLRSAVVIIAVTLGIFAGIFATAFTVGMVEQRINSAIENEVSHIQIHHTKFLENYEVQYAINNADSVIKSIQKIPEVKAVSKRTKIQAMATTSATGSGIILNGINPKQEQQVTAIYQKIIDGTYFEQGKRNPIVIGEKLAKKLSDRGRVKIRSKIVITLQRPDGILTSGAFRVVGIFRTNNSAFDEMNVYVRNNDLVRLTDFDNTKTHEIAILLNENESTNKITEKLKRLKHFRNLNIMQWKEIQPDLGMLTDFMDEMLYIYIVIILLALSFGIINTMLMAILERQKEIGMLMAIGMNKIRVFSMIMLETIFLSITGGILGMIISSLCIWYFGNKGIDLSAYSEANSSIGYSSIIYPEVDFDFYITLTLLIIFTAIVASIYPALRALRLKPAEAVRTI